MPITPNPTGSQCQRVLHKLMTQEVVHCWEFGKMKPGIVGHTARISDLRRKGYIITQHEKMVKGQRHSWYTLERLTHDQFMHLERTTGYPGTFIFEGKRLKEPIDNIKKVIVEGIETRKPITRVERVITLIILAIAAGVCYMIYIAFK